jgi:hypothetical protein
MSDFNSYFDCSADDPAKIKDPETVVAGYIANIDQWERWQFDWKLMLIKYDIPYFHMKEFIACNKAFKHPKWKSENYRKAFMGDMIDVIKSWTIASIASVIKQSVYDRANQGYKLDAYANPYVLAARDCAAQTRKFIRETIESTQAIAYIFEKGDEGHGLLVEAMIKTGLPAPIFKRPRPDLKNPQADRDDPPAIQLQTSDLNAWEVRRGEKDWRSKQKLRKSQFSLGSLPVGCRIWKQANDESVQDFIDYLGIPAR